MSAGSGSGRVARATRRALVLALGCAATDGVARAQLPERLLTQVSTDAGAVVAEFGCPMGFVSSYPQRSGGELRIELQPLRGCPAGGALDETLPVVRDNPAGLTEIRLESGLGTRRALVLHFSHTVDFVVRPHPGLTGIDVIVTRGVARAGVEAARPKVQPSRAPSRPLPPPEQLERELDEARIAMQRRDYDAAVRLYTKLLEYPEHPGRQQAQEYLGLARERKGQLAQAKLEYQEYLRRYPDGRDVDGVRQRLAALVTLDGASAPSGGAPDGSRWTLAGVVFQDYRHDQNTVSTTAATGGGSGVGQSGVDSDVDLQVRRRGDAIDLRARLYAGYVADLVGVNAGGAGGQFQLPQAYVEADDAHSRWLARVGRQSQGAGGAYGTFDGAFASWLPVRSLRLALAVGAPVDTYAAAATHGRTFGALSADVLGVAPGLDVGGFLFEERAGGVEDARQLGLEARYFQSGRSLVGQLNYDLSYRALNAATVLGTASLPGRWMLTALADHRENPFLGTYNALVGQTAGSLSELIRAQGIDAVRALARDRSAVSDTLTVGLQRPFTEFLDCGSDLGISRTGGVPASGGVPATPASGTALSASLQCLGGGWLVDHDAHTVGTSYTTRRGTRALAAYASARYPLGQGTRLGPRLQLTHTAGSDPATGTSAGWAVSPALLGDWRWHRVSVQFEAGYALAHLASSLPPGVPLDPGSQPPGTVPVTQQTRRFWFSLGYTWNF